MSVIYKGKSTTRSWATLPPEVIRLICTHELLEAANRAPLPNTWQKAELWQGRVVFTVIRDLENIERLMCVCPAWSAALDIHKCWQQAITVFDPHDRLLPTARAQRLSPYQYFKHYLYQRSCIPCRINYPAGNNGLLQARKVVYTHPFGNVPCCKEHRKDRFCGVCILDSSHEESGVAENEECDIWPMVEATCKTCRSERLWTVSMEGEIQLGSQLTREAEAIGGPRLVADDWESRQAIDSFLEFGEGAIRDVIGLCMEKKWLRSNTKISEMMRLTVATSRMQARMAENANAAGIGGIGDYESEEEELSDLDDDEHDELMSMTEESHNVRELAINDWARTRILDGLWHSPADQWYNIQGESQAQWLPSVSQLPSLPYVSATHPVSWSVSVTQSDNENAHPDPTAAREPPPPSLTLCSTAHEAYRRQLRAVLLPAMVNIVRKVVMECAVDGRDASQHVSRMGPDDVMRCLRDGRVWFNGMDWAQRRRQDLARDESDESSASEKSGSGSTSPVLSTSTLETTPSPPPISEDKSNSSRSDDATSSVISSSPTSRKGNILSTTSPLTLPIAISPVLESPTQIPSIPYIPDRLEELGTFTIEFITRNWREACTPLFQCRCKICDRAVQKANLEAGNVVPSHQPRAASERKEAVVLSPPVSIKLDAATPEDTTVTADPPVKDNEIRMQAPASSRKRSCEVAEIANDVVEVMTTATDERNLRSKTPPEKRLKVGRNDIVESIDLT